MTRSTFADWDPPLPGTFKRIATAEPRHRRHSGHYTAELEDRFRASALRRIEEKRARRQERARKEAA